MFPPQNVNDLRRRGGGTVRKTKREPLISTAADHPLRKPIYALSLTILVVFAYFVFFNNSQSSSNDPIKAVESKNVLSGSKYSAQTQRLYQDLLTQLKLSRTDPSVVLARNLQLPKNELFIRTETVQKLFDYAESATRDLYAAAYAADPNYHHVKCVETFAPGGRSILPQIEIGVRKFLADTQHETLYSQEMIRSYAEKVAVTEELQMGLPVWPDQNGIIAKKDIGAFTCIGHYYGDEYILNEYEKQFDWSIYGKKKEHPWRRKWDYYLTIPYHSFADKRLNIPENVTVAIDAYHSYNYSKYVKEGGQNLNWEQSKIKMSNLEEFINDPRKELYKPKMWKEDLERKNTEFVYCAVDGVLQTFVTSTKSIPKGRQLFIYYGPNYG